MKNKPIMNIGFGAPLPTPWMQMASILRMEPYIEDFCLFYRDSHEIHITIPQDWNFEVAEALLQGRTHADALVRHPSASHDPVYQESLSINLPRLAEGGFLNRSTRPTPYIGLNQPYWYDKKTKEVTNLIFVLREEYRKVVSHRFPSALFIPSNADEVCYHFPQIVEEFQRADMVVSDVHGAAYLAVACHVRKVTLLPMDFNEVDVGVDDPLPIKVFSRSVKSAALKISEEQAYRDLIDFADYELKNYQRYPPYLNVGDAKSWIQNEALQYCRGYGLDVGSNRWPLPGALASDIDSRKFDRAPFDFIFSSHCLEHIENWQEETQLWYESLKPGGTLFLYLPHPALETWQPGGQWVGHHHVWSPEPASLRVHLESLGFETLHYTAYPDSLWSFKIICKKK